MKNKGLLAAMTAAVALSTQAMAADTKEISEAKEIFKIAQNASEKSNCSGDKANCSGDKANCSGDKANCSGDKANCSGDKANCSGDKANCSGDKSSDSSDKQAANNSDREKCAPVYYDKNVLAKNKGACATAKHSCAGQNEQGESDAWIYVPKGVCDKIKAGKFDDVPDNIKAKLVLSDDNPTKPVADAVKTEVKQQAEALVKKVKEQAATAEQSSDSQSWSSWFMGLFGN